MSGSISGSYDGLSGWQLASATQLNDLINPSEISGSSQADWTSGKLDSWLETRGLDASVVRSIVENEEVNITGVEERGRYAFEDASNVTLGVVGEYEEEDAA